MSFVVQADVHGLMRIGERLRERAKKLAGEGLRPILREMAADMKAQTIKQAIALRTPSLSEAYAAWKQNQVGSALRMMHLTGVMMSSLYTRVFKPGVVDAGSWVIRRSFAGAHYSGLSNRELAEIHANGRGVPLRDFLSLPASWTAKWRQRVLQHIRSLR